MYVASYNDVAHNNGTAKGGLSTEYSTKDVPGYIYKIDGTAQGNVGWFTDDTLDNQGYNNMYAKSGTYWWLASPSSDYYQRVCYVFNSALGNNNYDYAYGVGPVVSLPSTFTVEVEQ